MQINIRQKLKKFVPIFLKAKEENLSEADTSQRISKFFEDVLEYDPFAEITREIGVKGKRIDLTVKIDGVERFLVEVKRAGIELRDRHSDQGELYAMRSGIQWVLLTNGVTWNFYHLTPAEGEGTGTEYDLVFSADLSMDSDSISNAAEKIGLLHRSSIKAARHEAYWKEKSALSPESIAKAIFYEETLLFIRREIRRRECMLVDVDELAGCIYSLFTPDAQVHMGPLKIRGKRSSKAASKSPTGSVCKESVTTECISVVPVSVAGNILPIECPPEIDLPNSGRAEA